MHRIEPMNLSRRFFLALLVGVLSLAAPSVGFSADKAPVFGPYEAIVFNKDILQDVRVDDKGDVYIMLQPAHRNDQLTMKISMQPGGPYRKWFTEEEVLVARENTGRAANIWTDRIQTSANYIEYYSGGTLFLHLKKVN